MEKQAHQAVHQQQAPLAPLVPLEVLAEQHHLLIMQMVLLIMTVTGIIDQ
jgi:hypothetical protein